MAAAHEAEHVDLLLRLDPAFAEVVDAADPPRVRVGRRRRSHFAELARAITYQQLAGAAAATIHGRFEALFDGPVTADAVLSTDTGDLRSVGLSAAKAASIVDLAEHVVTGRVNLASIGRRPDEQVVAELVQV